MKPKITAHVKLTYGQMKIYEELSRFSREQYDGNATRFDCVCYMVGYNGAVTSDVIVAINRLYKEGYIQR